MTGPRSSKSNYRPTSRPLLSDFEDAGLADALVSLVGHGLVRTEPNVDWTRWEKLLLAQAGPPRGRRGLQQVHPSEPARVDPGARGLSPTRA